MCPAMLDPPASGQRQSLRDPSSTNSRATAPSRPSPDFGAHRVRSAWDRFGVEVTSAYITVPPRSAAMVLTQGMAASRSMAARISATDRARAMFSQVSPERVFRWLESWTA